MNELSSFFVEKARIELGEDENRKKQCIEQFRKWLKKHPFIKAGDFGIHATFNVTYLL
jgi:hypothetical protein